MTKTQRPAEIREGCAEQTTQPYWYGDKSKQPPIDYRLYGLVNTFSGRLLAFLSGIEVGPRPQLLLIRWLIWLRRIWWRCGRIWCLTCSPWCHGDWHCDFMAIYGTSQMFDGRVFGQYLSQQHPVVDDCAILRNEDADSSCDAVESCLVGCVVKGQSHV